MYRVMECGGLVVHRLFQGYLYGFSSVFLFCLSHYLLSFFLGIVSNCAFTVQLCWCDHAKRVDEVVLMGSEDKARVEAN